MYYFQVYDVPKELDIFRSRSIGGFIIIIAFLILYFSLKEFTEVNEDPIPTSPSNLIIKDNIYAYSRNPMYLGLLILQIGLGMLLSVIHIIFFAFLTYLVLKYYVIIPEERYLEEKFGEKYLSYKTSVRRWF
jgi:protein-S-isoprenylcysteine O-methyltransferase Ste14